MVYIEEGYRNEQGKVATRIVQKLGILEDLQKDDPDYITKLKNSFKDARYKKRTEATVNAKNFLSKVISEQEQSTAPSYGVNPILNYSMMFLRSLFSKDHFNLEYKLSYLLKDYKYQFNLADTFAYLTFIKAIEPASVNTAHVNSENYLGTKLEDVTLDNLYSTYDFIHENKDALLKFINSRLDVLCNRSGNTMVFYDVTNVYFETTLTDEEKGFLREHAQEEVKAIIEAKIASNELSELDLADIEVRDNNKVIGYKIENIPKDYIPELKEICYLRMRGMSKEHRFDLPLVSVALVIDENGFPIDYQIYPGNCAEITKMETSIKAMQAKYNVKDTIVVADRGLNSVSNLKMLQDKNYGFIVAQKISNLDQDTIEKIINPTDYTEVLNGEFKYKCIKNFIKKGNNGENITCDLVITFSQDRYNRDIAVFEDDLSKAQLAVLNQSKIRSASRQWCTLVNKEGKDKKVVSLNEASIKKRKSLCGYAAMVYKKVPNQTTKELSIEEITKSYHCLVRIEDCFRVMKSHLNLRPMFVRTESHIDAHVFCCVFALTLLRYIEYRLDKSGHHMSIERIIKALNDCNFMVAKNELIQGMQFVRVSKYKDLFRGDDYKKRDNELIARLLDEHQYVSDLDNILGAFGLQINRVSSRSDLEHVFSRRYLSDEKMVGRIYSKII